LITTTSPSAPTSSIVVSVRLTIEAIVASSLKQGKNAEIASTAGFTGALGTSNT
jgi:hypothetical protein